jgi:hypothetical protein
MLNKKQVVIIAVCNFLRDNKVLERYCYNAAVFHNIKIPENATPVDRTKIIFDKLIKRVDSMYSYYISEFISQFDTSFDWMETPEGHAFWVDISSKWREKYISYIKKYDNMRNI